MEDLPNTKREFTKEQQLYYDKAVSHLQNTAFEKEKQEALLKAFSQFLKDDKNSFYGTAFTDQSFADFFEEFIKTAAAQKTGENSKGTAAEIVEKINAITGIEPPAKTLSAAERNNGSKSSCKKAEPGTQNKTSEKHSSPISPSKAEADGNSSPTAAAAQENSAETQEPCPLNETTKTTADNPLDTDNLCTNEGSEHNENGAPEGNCPDAPAADTNAENILPDTPTHFDEEFANLYSKIVKQMKQDFQQDKQFTQAVVTLTEKLTDAQNTNTPAEEFTPKGYSEFYNDLTKSLTPIEKEPSLPKTTPIKKWAKWLFLFTTIILLLLQGTYFLVNYLYGAEFLFDSMAYIINGLIVIFATGYIVCRFQKKFIKIAAMLFCALICIINFVIMTVDVSEFEKHYYTSPDGKLQMILKRDIKTGDTWVSSNKRFLFVRFNRRIPRPINTDMKTQWLTNDICVVTYTDTSGDLIQYVATYGDRGDGSYYFVENVLTGFWREQGSAPETTLQIDNNGVVLNIGGKREFYSHTDCVQQGTTALILRREGIPKWTIAMNEDCKLNKGDLRVPVGSKITLCPVSMSETPAHTMTFTNENNIYSSVETNGSEDSKQTLTQMDDILQKDPKLKNTKELPGGVYKIKTSSTDYFALGREAYLAFMDKHPKETKIKTHIYLTKVLAGDKTDFLVKVYTEETITTQPEHQPDGEPVQVTNYGRYFFRIKKGDGACLVYPVEEEDGYIWLKKLETPMELDTDDNKKYIYNFPRKKKS